MTNLFFELNLDKATLPARGNLPRNLIIPSTIHRVSCLCAQVLAVDARVQFTAAFRGNKIRRE